MANVSQLVWKPKLRRRVTELKKVPAYIPASDGRITVLAGLLAYLKQFPERYQLAITKTAGLPLHPLAMAPEDAAILNLDANQQRAFDVCAGARYGTVESPTGSGKSRCLIALALAAARQHNVLMLMPGKTAKDNYERQYYDLFAGHACRLMPYAELRAGADIAPTGHVILSGATMIGNDGQRAGELLSTVGTVIADEAHHWSSPGWQALPYLIPSLSRSFGVTATAFNKALSDRVTKMMLDDVQVLAGAGPLLLSIPPSEAERIDLPDVHNLIFPWSTDRRFKSGVSWSRLAPQLARYEARMAAIAGLVRVALATGRTAIIPVEHKGYAEQLRQLTDDPAAACWFGGGQLITAGGVEQLDTAAVIRRVEAGELRALFVTRHVDEALDIPCIDTTILTEGKRRGRIRQRVGRSTRKSLRKAVVINLYDADGGMMERQSKARSQDLTTYYGTAEFNHGTVPELAHAIASYEHTPDG